MCILNYKKNLEMLKMAISGWLEVSRRLFSKIHIQIKTKSSNVTPRSVEDFIIGKFNFKQSGYLVCGGNVKISVWTATPLIPTGLQGVIFLSKPSPLIVHKSCVSNSSCPFIIWFGMFFIDSQYLLFLFPS